MATLHHTIKKAEKISGTKVTIGQNNQYQLSYKGFNISFYANGRLEPNVEATCFYVIKHGIEDDLQTDYFPGTFRDNINQCFKFVDNYPTN